MSNEIVGGTVNDIRIDYINGVVSKTFRMGNGMSQDTLVRREAEKTAFRKLGFAPNLLGEDTENIYMSYIDGEKELDTAVRGYPLPVQQKIFRISGNFLADIHNKEHHKVPVDYHAQHMERVYDLLERTQHRLPAHGLDPLAVCDFLQRSYNLQEIDRAGFRFVHGDYWLNNLIGQRVNGSYRLNGIIDWELAGVNTPYEDFAVVKMSIEDAHQDSSKPFWKGYEIEPDRLLQVHYATVKTLDWISGEDPSDTLRTPFYQSKFDMIRENL